jgi:hypothetical protein
LEAFVFKSDRRLTSPNPLLLAQLTNKRGRKMINIVKRVSVVVGALMFTAVSAIAIAQDVITVNPYQDEYLIMVGTEYDLSSGKLFYIPSNEDGTFGTVSVVADIGYRAGAGIADFDNDGNLDFVAGAREDYSGVANFYLFKNGGNGNFVKYLIASDIPCPERVGTFAVADFDENGFKDFVVPINLSYDIYLFTNNSDNTFAVSKLEPLSAGAAKEGDFNEDGHMDFVITDYFNAKVYLYEGDGSGGFNVQELFTVVGSYRAEQITVGDFNEDGHLDIIVDDFIPYGGGGHLYLGDGTGNFTFGSTVYSRPVNGAWTYGLDSFDFDKDGHRDLILSSYEYPPTGLVFIMKGNGDGTFQDAEKIDMEPLGSVFPVTPAEIPVPTVAIDIKPGSDPNSINLGSKGVVPVAVLTTTEFDASNVDPATVRFADAEPVHWAMEDVDGDGDMDLLFHFKTQELNLTEASTEAALTCTTEDGIDIQGTDTVKIVPQENK